MLRVLRDEVRSNTVYGEKRVDLMLEGLRLLVSPFGGRGDVNCATMDCLIVRSKLITLLTDMVGFVPNILGSMKLLDALSNSIAVLREMMHIYTKIQSFAPCSLLSLETPCYTNQSGP